MKQLAMLWLVLGVVPSFLQVDERQGRPMERSIPSTPQPSVLLGGEIAVVVDEAVIVPTAFYLLGRRVPIAGVSGGPIRRQVKFPGLAPGVYELVPEYRGGIRGEPIKVSVAESRTGTAHFSRAPLGGAQVASSRCLGSDKLRLDRVHGTRASLTQVLGEQSNCNWVVEGLLPGTYQASLRGEKGSGGSTTFEIKKQEIAAVHLSPARATVRGKILYNGLAASGAEVMFTALSARFGDTTVRTDSLGGYVAYLDDAAQYSLSVSIDGARSPLARVVRVSQGSNVVDWAITAGSIGVRVIGANPEKPVVVTIRGRGISLSHPLAAGNTKLNREGLPIGEYLVYATQRTSAALVSEAQRVVISEGRRLQHSLVLQLRRTDAELILRDSNGEPISGAEVFVGPTSLTQLTRRAVPLVPSIRPGVYSLAQVPPGIEIQIRTPEPYVPLCRVVPRAGSIEVVVERGREIQLQLPGGGAAQISPMAGSLGGFAGLECPIALVHFSARPVTQRVQTGKQAVFSLFVVRNAPKNSLLKWYRAGSSTEESVAVSPQGMLNLPHRPK